MDASIIAFQNLVEQAAKAYDYFTEDELEAAADELRAKEAAKGGVK